MKRIRVLQVVSRMNQGGIENFIMNVYRNIDRDKVQFDFLVHHKDKSFFDDEIKRLGGNIYYFSVMDDKNIFKYIHNLCKFFKKHKEYKIIHGHLASMGFLYLTIAKINKVPIRIAHSHGTSHTPDLKGYIKGVLFKFFKYPANFYYACSTEAGKYMFKNKKFEVIPNAVKLQKFLYNNDFRTEIRNELNLSDKFVVLNVGRLNLQKNHTYILKIFKHIVEEKPKSALLIVGEGERKENIKKEIHRLGLNDNVYMLGIRDDVEKIYCASDAFLMPSLYEGLPVTGIEAQASGIKCFFSDTITREVELTKNATFLSLDELPHIWAKKILKTAQNYDRKYDDSVLNTDFNIDALSKKMIDFYIKHYE